MWCRGECRGTDGCSPVKAQSHRGPHMSHRLRVEQIWDLVGENWGFRFFPIWIGSTWLEKQNCEQSGEKCGGMKVLLKVE